MKAWVGALLILLGTILMSAPPRAAAAADTEKMQPRTVADSASVILRSTHIVVLQILNVEGGDWVPGPRGTSSRGIRMRARVEASIKGRLDVTASQDVVLAGQLTRSGPRDVGLPGVWSQHPPQAGSRVAVFSSAAASGADAVLAEPALLRVLPADAVEADLRQATAIEAGGAPIAAALERVSEPPALSPLFGEYVVARLDLENVIAAPQDFGRLLRWLEVPGRSAAVRLFVVPALYQRVLAVGPPARAGAVQLALSSLRWLADAPADDALAAQLVETYLHQLLGLEGATAKLAPDVLFANAPDERSRARKSLLQRPAGRARDRLVAWIGA